MAAGSGSGGRLALVSLSAISIIVMNQSESKLIITTTLAVELGSAQVNGHGQAAMLFSMLIISSWGRSMKLSFFAILTVFDLRYWFGSRGTGNGAKTAQT